MSDCPEPEYLQLLVRAGGQIFLAAADPVWVGPYACEVERVRAALAC